MEKRETGTVEETYKITEVVALFDKSAALEAAIEKFPGKGSGLWLVRGCWICIIAMFFSMESSLLLLP